VPSQIKYTEKPAEMPPGGKAPEEKKPQEKRRSEKIFFLSGLWEAYIL
jgi:hypothetical protein